MTEMEQDRTDAGVPSPLDLVLNPGKYGLTQCPHCNGYGSSLKESVDPCTYCGGEGLVTLERAKGYGVGRAPADKP